MINEAIENNIRNISVDTIHIAKDLHDIAVSLRILAGRSSLKKEKLEGDIKELKVKIYWMRNELLLSGTQNGTKLQALEASLKQKSADLAAEEERLLTDEK